MVALGAIFLLILTDAMDLLKIDPRIQTIFLGIIVVLAVAVDELSKRRAAACLRPDVSDTRCLRPRDRRSTAARCVGGSSCCCPC